MGHRIGTFLLVIGLGVLAWAATVYFWKDPFTTAYTAYEQRRLASNLDEQFDNWHPTREPVAESGDPVKRDDVSREAKRYRLASEDGDAIARIRIPELDLNLVVVNGTSVSDLRRGPGRHLETYMPGEHELVYIAGHRTTYGAPFGDINELKPGDTITLELPYATIVYRVTRHRIVDDNDVSVLESPHHEQLVLQACHPRFFASQRYLVYATPVSVKRRT
ncbi:MAG TPA: class E sortase [Gaiellaceae bacterium]|jgi:sortase A|nr:class E sortase [Gaiellaceae bacterium]